MYEGGGSEMVADFNYSTGMDGEGPSSGSPGCLVSEKLYHVFSLASVAGGGSKNKKGTKISTCLDCEEGVLDQCYEDCIFL